MTLQRLSLQTLALAFLIGTTGVMAEEEEAEAPAKPIYYELEPDILVNLKEPKHYLRIAIQVMSRDQLTIDMVEQNTPMLRHHLIMQLSEESYKTLGNPSGREEVRKKALEKFNTLLDEESKGMEVAGLYFTNFMMQ